MKVLNLFLILQIIFYLNLFSTGINLLNKNSSIKISSGSSLTLDSSISSVKGKIIKDSDANISGSNINFLGGSFYDGKSKSRINGTLNLGQTKKIILDGNKSFEGRRGEILQDIIISGLHNLLQGVLFASGDVDLQDSLSAVSVALKNRLDSNINLNSGSLKLEEDLFFLDYKRIKGPGKIYFNGYKLSFGATDLTWNEPLFLDSAADLELHANTYLEDTWSFSGNSVLSCNSNILYSICSNGIVVRPNSHLLIKDAIIYGLSGNKISCLTDDSTITLQNVKCIFDGNFTFSKGALIFLENVEFIGKNKKFIYQTNMTSTIKDNALVTLSDGFTFSYDPISGNKNLLEFEADDSRLYLNGGNLYSAYNGLNLIKGQMLVDNNSSIIIEERPWEYSTIIGTEEFDGITYTTYDYTYGTSGGVNIGNGVTDFKVKILSGSKLSIDNGTLYYKNIVKDSFNLINNSSSLKINSGAHLNLEQSLSVSPGKILLYKNSSLIKNSDIDLLGSTFILS